MTDIDPTITGPLGHAVAQETLEIMALHGVPATAANYEVWLSYRLQRIPGLKQAIDERICAGLQFSPEVNGDLYDTFFTGVRMSAQMVMAGEKIARDLTQLMSALHDANDKNDKYGRTLETAAGTLEQAVDPRQLRELISTLAAATLDMANHNRTLTDQLHKSSREIDTLRTNLESARTESLTDALTGVANRRMFDETLRMRISESRGDRTELCVLMCDIDHFKRFNDTWGHHTGDQVLRFVASTLKHYARPDYLVSRYGGEEFALIMPRTTIDMARQTAEHLRQTIHAKRLRRRSTNEDLGQVTVSLGIARLQAGDSQQAFVERADACLYASKREGRNRVTIDAVPILNVA